MCGALLHAADSQALRLLAPENRLEWKMEATADIASIVIKRMYCKMDFGSACEFEEPPNYHALKAWATKDRGWYELPQSSA